MVVTMSYYGEEIDQVKTAYAQAAAEEFRRVKEEKLAKMAWLHRLRRLMHTKSWANRFASPRRRAG